MGSSDEVPDSGFLEEVTSENFCWMKMREILGRRNTVHAKAERQ